MCSKKFIISVSNERRYIPGHGDLQ